MNIRIIEKYYAKQRRNRALIISLVVHGIAIIATAIWLLKPLIEQTEDTIVVDFVPPLPRIHRPKKIIREVQQSNAAATVTIQNPATKRLPASMSSLPQVSEKPKLEAPPISTAVTPRPFAGVHPCSY